MASTPARKPARPASVTYALARALNLVKPSPECAPTVALAKRYAAMLDEDPEKLGRLGRQFLAVLVELRMTPKARAGVVGGEFLSEPEPGDVVPNLDAGGGASDDGDSPLDSVDELRRQRDRRVHRTSTVDAAP